MTDDLVKRLRCYADIDDAVYHPWVYAEAADRIEKLMEENGVLFVANIRLNSRADLDLEPYVDRIETLEAALDDMAQYVSRADWHYLKDETRKALEGKDD